MALSKQQLNHRRVKNKWKIHLEKWATSGRNQADYCKENSLNQSSFSKWKSRLGFQDTNSITPQLIKVPDQLCSFSERNHKFEQEMDDIFLYVGEFKVGLKQNFSSSTLKKLITILKEV